jgi:hypothetical protein
VLEALGVLGVAAAGDGGGVFGAVVLVGTMMMVTLG